MHKLMEYVCDELDELERKVDKGGKLSAAEMQYVDLLSHTKKNLLTADAMTGEDEYSNDGMGRMYSGTDRNGSYNTGSYARGRSRARRDSMGRYSNMGYSRAADDMIAQLEDMMHDAQDERVRQEFQKFIQKIEQL